ncbi:MAG: glutaredoxin family protein [Desulfobacterales bacterium]|jgi:glutaredoxin
MQLNRFFLAFFVLILAMATSSAEIYKWVDEDGVIHYSDSGSQDISEVSEEEQIQSPEPEPLDTPQANEERQNAELPSDFFDILDQSADEAEADEAPTVEIYVTSWCRYCHAAKNFFRSRGIEFTVYDIEKDRDAARRMMTFTKIKAVPFVVINGRGIQGYSEQAYELALKN